MDNRDHLITLRTTTGMTRKEFCEYFEIPYRTLQDWELGSRKMPDYLLRLMAYKSKRKSLQKQRKIKFLYFQTIFIFISLLFCA